MVTGLIMRRFKIGALTAVCVCVCLLGLLVARRHYKVQERRRLLALIESAEEGGRLPMSDPSIWMAEHGANEPDPSSQEGMARLRNERLELPGRVARFRELLNKLDSVYTNASQTSVQDYLSDVDACISGLSRTSCAEVLRPVKWDGVGWDVDRTLRNVNSASAFATAIERYCLLFGRFADLIWERAGDAYGAAEADRRTFNVLKKCEKSFPEMSAATDACLAEWRENRCDNADSNYCRAFREREGLYRSHWESYVKKNTSMQNAVTDWYCWHLKWARNALRREPKWSPDFKAK